jgi:hypothetical protein
MQKQRFSLRIAYFCYGGNGGISSLHPDVMEWMLLTVPGLKSDSRLHQVSVRRYSDTPITMTRNAAVVDAKQDGCDFILMIDSDMAPDLLLSKDAAAKPFMQVALAKLCDDYNKCLAGSMVAAPYCGPPPFENIYVFLWRGQQSESPDQGFSLEQFTREEAMQRTGLERVAALPTGLFMADLRLYDLIAPVEETDSPYHYYEWRDKFATHKNSTEDVTVTRDISMACLQKHGYNPVHCAWDCWAGHWKPKCVGKPTALTASDVSAKFVRAARNGLPKGKAIAIADFDIGGAWPDTTPEENFLDHTGPIPHSVQAD